MSAMRTPAEQAALESFIGAATGGEESGYPDRAAIVASDMKGADEALWHYLHEGRATVVVDSSGAELMVMPAQVPRVHRYLNELRRRIAVEVYIRRERPAAPATVAVHADIGRHAIGEIREAVPV